MAHLNFNVKINADSIEDKLNKLIQDDETMLAIHYLFAKTIDPWVPYLNGPLSETVEIEPNLIRYIQPYARYQYYGIGFNHTVDFHPLASALWDEEAMKTQLETFKEQVKDILIRRAKQLYG